MKLGESSMFLKLLNKFYVIIFLSTAYTQAATKPAEALVMTFNVENLFDTKHDPGKDDWEYLPATVKQSGEHRKRCASKNRGRKACLDKDWNDAVLKKKFNQLAKVILSVNKGRGPDILIMQEVENISVIEELRKSYLNSAAYYPPILVEGSDPRGIDIAILSRFSLIQEPKLHQIPFKEFRGKSRSILESRFHIGPYNLTVLGIHFPSPRNPIIARIEAFHFLNKLSDELIKKSDGVLAAGDFNVKAGEDSRLYRKIASDNFTISHMISCTRCLGTNYYSRNDSWSFLDAIAVHKKSKWVIDAESVAVIQHPDHQNKNGSPKRFSLRSGEGVSDHFPIFARIKINAGKS